MWWKFVQKPVRVDITIFDRINPGEWEASKKLDGHRLILIRDGNNIRFFTRQKNIIEIPHNMREDLQKLNLPSGTVLDGEIWNNDKRGSWRTNLDSTCYASFWDIIRFGEKDLSTLPLTERRKYLSDTVPDGLESLSVVPAAIPSLSNYLEWQKEAKDHREKTGAKSGFIHGMVLKRKMSPRRDHATQSKVHPDWVKLVFSQMESGWQG